MLETTPHYAGCFSNVKQKPSCCLKAVWFDCKEKTAVGGHRQS